jgi:hypothetical protein
MSFATIAQCDMCSAVTDDAFTFCRVEVMISYPGTEVAITEQRNTKALLCPRCAEPILVFQRTMLAEGADKTEDAKRQRVKRLNERILSALKQTE